MAEGGEGRISLKVVPWMNKLEFQTVFKSLYSNNVEDQHWAVGRISAWALRGHEEDLVAVQTTAALVRAKIQDRAMQHNVSFCTSEDISPMYCMAIIKFVNLITEKGQDGGHRIPLKEIAHRFDIPDWIIDLRNQASHSSSPSLEKLREGAEVCLNWLEENYWKPEDENTTDYCPASDNEDEIACRQALLEFQRTQCQHLFDTAKPVRKKEIKLVLNNIAKLAKNNSESMVKTLVTEDFLLSFTACSKPLVESSDAFFAEEAVALPKKMETFWVPVITVLHDESLVEELVLCLLNAVGPLCLEKQRIAMSWVWQILSCSCESWESSTSKDAELSKVLRPLPPIFNWSELMEACLYSYSKYMPAVLPILIDHVFPPIPTDKKNRLMGFVAIATGALADATSDTYASTENQRIYTVDDIKTVLELQDVVDKGKTSLYHKEESPWKKCTNDINWEDYPLGYVFGLGKGPMHPKALGFSLVTGSKSEDKDASSSDTAPAPMQGEANKSETENTKVYDDKKRNEEDIADEDDDDAVEDDEEDEEPCATGSSAWYCDPNDIVIM